MITLIGFDVANYGGVENCSYKRKSQRKLYRHSVWRHKFVKSCVVKTTPSAVRKDVWALVLMKWKKKWWVTLCWILKDRISSQHGSRAQRDQECLGLAQKERVK